MALKTSLVITGDATNAEAALAALDKGLGEASAEAKRLEKAFADADKSIDQLAGAQARAKAETAAAKAEFKAGTITQKDYNARLLETKTALGQVEASHRNAVIALRQAQGAIGGATTSLAAARAGYTNFGRQVQDVAVQIQGGANLGTIISQQGGQIADAVAMMGGRFAGFASFMAGPWGALITVGIGVLVNLGLELAKTSDEMDKVKFASSSLGDAQGILGNVIDLTTGKIKTQSAALIALARAQIIAGQIESKKRQAEARSTIASSADFRTEFGGGLGGGFSATRRQGAEAQVESNFRNGLINTDQAVQQLDRLRKAGSITENVFISLAKAYANFGVEKANQDVFKNAEKLLNGTGGRELLKPEKNKKPTAAKSDQLSKLASFADQIDAKIAGIRDEFAELPTQVEKGNAAVRQLDLILKSVEGRKGLKPELVAKFRQEIAATKNVIEQSLNRPFRDYIELAQQAAEIDRLLVAGREDEAQALRIVFDLQKRQGPLQQEQLEAILKTVRAQRQMDLVLRDQRDLIEANINAVRDFRASLVGTVADALRGRFSVTRVLASLGNSYVNIVSQKLVEGLFGDTLRKLEAQATGADKVDAAGNRIAASLDAGGKAVEGFAATVAWVNASLGKSNTVGAAASLPGGVGGIGGSISEFLGKLTAGVAEKIAQQANGNGIPEATGPEIVVEGRKAAKVDLSGVGALLVDIVDRTMSRAGVTIPKVVTEGIKAALGRLEQALPQALQGAFTGSTASRIVLGDRGVGGSIGSAIGGALGGKVGEQLLGKGLTAIGGKLLGGFAGPIGSALGGVLGGLIGGAFKKTTSGGASIGLNAQGQGAVTGTAGNSADLKKTASGYGGTVVSALDQIAQALGADLGNFNVAIGKRSSGWIKVSASGNAAATTGKKVTSDIIYNGKDEGEALMAALANAIGDGAIKGISAAVQKALNSSTDVDKAVKEALKVQQVELAIGGVGAEMEKAFKDFERQAAKRLRIARQYGFDVAKLEEVNAKDRLKLTERLMKEQVGSLQSLIEQLTSGSLFEGSAVDRRSAILSEISKTRDAANRGEEGAADKLAGLLEQLNSVSKEVYGTTGGFANDRATIIDQARETVAKANQRISDAQKGSDPALAATNAALDENNDQNAAIIAALEQSNALLAKLTGTKLNTSALAALARV